MLARCIKRVVSEDKSTQMGQDLFAEERINLENEIRMLIMS